MGSQLSCLVGLGILALGWGVGGLLVFSFLSPRLIPFCFTLLCTPRWLAGWLAVVLCVLPC